MEVVVHSEQDPSFKIPGLDRAEGLGEGTNLLF